MFKINISNNNFKKAIVREQLALVKNEYHICRNFFWFFGTHLKVKYNKVYIFHV